MTLMTCLALFAFSNGDPLEKMMVQTRFMDAAKMLKQKAYAMESPADVRAYVVFLSEYYAHQLGFRTFYMKNLGAGEKLRLLRASQTLISGPDMVALESNLEDVLIKARKRFPDHPEIEFATAVYLQAGDCCLTGPRLEMADARRLEIFKEAEEKGLRSGTSTWAMALDLLKKPDAEVARLSDLLNKAKSLKPHEPKVQGAFVDDLLRLGKFEEGLPHARNLFEEAVAPEEKTDALVRVARTYAGLGKSDRVMEAVEGGLKINPKHSFLFLLGLETLRKGQEEQPYVDLVGNYLKQDPESPALFRVYFDYLTTRGSQQWDTNFIKSYRQWKDDSNLAHITRRLNITAYSLLMFRNDVAAQELEKVKYLLEQEQNPDESLRVTTAALEAEIKRRTFKRP